MHFSLSMSHTCRIRAALRCAALTVLLAGVANTGTAQPTPVAGSQRATRAELASRVATLEQQLAAGRLGGDARKRIDGEIARLRTRLQQGDFRVGDRFVITIRQDTVRSDTASVRDSLLVAIQNLPDVSLAGVLRAELDDKLNAHVARYLRNATVRTSVLTRVAVMGTVASPGFYYVSPDRPVSDVIMLAGGPAEDAKLNEIEIHRGSETILKKKDAKRLVEEGRTLEQLDVQSGDEIRVPKKRRFNWQVITQIILVASTLFFAILQFVQWYANRQDN